MGNLEDINAVTSKIIGAAIEVHRVLGPGFLERIYEEALAAEMHLREIAFERQKPVSVNYKGHAVGEGQLDFLVEDCVIVELKAVDGLLPVHTAQIMSYLKITQYRMGLLINFNVDLLKKGIRRIVLN